MTRSKKIFLAIMILFFLGLLALAIDISRRTTFPGGRKKARQSTGVVIDSRSSALSTIRRS